jgi:hypothetical protein
VSTVAKHHLQLMLMNEFEYQFEVYTLDSMRAYVAEPA